MKKWIITLLLILLPIYAEAGGIMTMGGGVAAAGATWTEIWSAAGQTGGSLYNGQSASTENFRNYIDGINSHITSSATTIRVKFQASTGGMTIQGCAIGKQDPDYPDRYKEPPTPLRFKYGGEDISAENPVVLGSNESAYSDALTFTIDHTVNYLIHVWNGSGFANYGGWYKDGVVEGGYNTSATDYTLTVLYSGNDVNYLVGIASIEKYE